MNFNTIHPNYIVEMVAKYWPGCLYRPLLIAIAGPKSELRAMLIENMTRNGATDYELWTVHDYYYYMDEAMKIDIR